MSVTRSQEIQVGIAVILAVITLVVGLLWFEDYRFDQTTIEAKVLFEDIGGLGVGDAVHVRGVKLGKVSSVELLPEGVVITCELDSRVHIAENARFMISSLGLVGERIMAVDPGDGPPADVGSIVFDGIEEFNITQMAGQMSQIGDRLGEVLDAVDRALAEIEDKGGIDGMVVEATRAAKELADFLQANQANLTAASRSLAHSSAVVDTFLSENTDKLGAGIESITSVAAHADSLIAGLDAAAADLQVILAAVKNQDGLVGKLVADPGMAADVEGTLSGINALIADIRRNPDRYLSVKVF